MQKQSCITPVVICLTIKKLSMNLLKVIQIILIYIIILGVASARNGEKEEAMEYYSKAIELNPDYAEALINKAQLILDR